MTTKTVLLSLVALINVVFILGWIWAVRRHRLSGRPTWGDVAIGCVTDFLDTLGIGSFAPTTALFKFRRRPADELIPGTLNVGHNASACLETTLYVTAVAVDPTLLACAIGSAAVGAWLGAGIVSRLPRRTIQICMGIALLIAAVFFVMRNLGWFPQGGEAFSLSGWRFGVAVAANFVFGALMCIGIGNYAPSVILLSLLGMHPLAAFPIMIGSDGLVQPVASLGFFRSGRFSHGTSLGLTLGGVIGALIAFFIVKDLLDVRLLRWLIILVVTYASVSMLRSAYRERAAAPAAT